MAAIKKMKKDWKKLLTKPRRSGNLTKLSDSEAGCAAKKTSEKKKKVVDK